MPRYNANEIVNESSKSNEKHLYFLSKDNMDNKTLYPRVPENYFTKNGHEDNETKRVCFATSIHKALMAISMRMKDMILYVHVPKTMNIETYKPTTKQVPDCKITGETWVTHPIGLKCIGKIKVIDDSGKDGHKFKYGDKEAELYDWDWEWIEKDKDIIKERSIVKENLLISDKDFSNNLEKWEDSNYPVLLITGLSGGGKSTLANQLAKEYKADVVELDQLEYNHNNSKNNFLKKFMESDSKYNQYNHISEYWKDKNDNTDKDKLIKTVKEYIHFCVSYALKNNIKTIIEGIQIYQLMYTKEDLIYMTDKPIIIMGSSPLISKLRQFKRIISGGNGGQTLKTLIQDNNYLSDFRNDIKSTIKETKEDDEMGIRFNLNENKEIIVRPQYELCLLESGVSYQKKYKCPYCETRLDRQKLITHILDEHEDFIPENYTATRIVFNIINKKEKGSCVICGKETLWDENKAKYDRFCCEKCVQDYRKQRDEAMIRTKGKLYVTDDPEFQKKMLANRGISGEYIWSDGIKRTYTGSYEKKLLEFLDEVMGFKSLDVITPGDTVLYEDNEGKERAWILDVTIIPYNLQIDAKDGGDNPNNREMPEYRAKQTSKEKAIFEQGKYNYLRLTNNNFGQLINTLAQIKLNLLDNKQDKIWHVNEYMAMSGVNPVVTKTADSKPVSYIVPCMIQNSFVEPLYSRDQYLEKLYRIVDGKLILTNRSEVKKQFDVSTKLLKSSVADKVKIGIDELITKEQYVDHNMMFEMLTGHQLLDKNQYFFDENLEVELEGFYKSKIRRDIIEATFSNLLNQYKVSICENAHNIKYKNLTILRDNKGFYAYNEETNKRTGSYELINEIPDEVLDLLNDDDFLDTDDDFNFEEIS